MKEKTKKRVFLWLFVVTLFFALAFLSIALTNHNQLVALEQKYEQVQEQNSNLSSINATATQLSQFKRTYCKNFSETTDVKEIRSLAENYIIAEIKNARNIVFDEIHLVGDNCNARWWVVAEYENRVEDEKTPAGAVFLTIDAVDKDLREFNAFTCAHTTYTTGSTYTISGCKYQWSLNNILGETKHEAQKKVELEERG